jgi:glycosyltransferase involved in cell wall biosynthesis
MNLGIVIPAIDEEESIGTVVGRVLEVEELPRNLRIVVCDNGSLDNTASIAAAAGAEVVRVRRRGYGAACQGGVAHLANWPDMIVFLDGDGSSRPEEIPRLSKTVADGECDLAIGCRPWSSPMTPPQRWGTWFAVRAVNFLWGSDYSDMGPFRCISKTSLERIGMSDQTWGWTIEMQILAQVYGLRVKEVPVSWQKRIAGVSKISGTILGVVRAGLRIIWTVARYAFSSRISHRVV